MSPQLDKQLCEKYPMLYRQRYLAPQETCMCWGFEGIGDSWYKVIDDLSNSLEKINNKLPEKYKKIEAGQVKSKFGGLRFYLDNIPEKYSKKVDKLVTRAEKKCSKTCEVCGRKATLRNINEWYETLCYSCLQKIRKN